MRYLSLFSGIEAASVAWHGLGWSPVAFAEVEPFPSAVLAERFPTVPNWGDVTKFKEWPDVCLCNSSDGNRPNRESRPTGSGMVGGCDVHAKYGRSSRSQLCNQCGGLYEPIDLVVGGSPCQSFSVAGLRKGLDDPRGNLALTYLAIVERYKPEWVIWENVPGALSSSRGRDFSSFIGALDEIGYGYAWRVLDAQFTRTPDYPRAVPQRRRRLFVVGNLRDWRRAAAVLFDSESLSGNPPPSRKKRQGTTANASDGIGTGSRGVEYASTVSTIDAKNRVDRGDSQHLDRLIVQEPICYENHANDSRIKELKDNTSPTVSSRWGTGGNNQALVQASMFKVRGGSEVETGTNGSTNIGKAAGKGYLGSDEVTFTVASVQDQWLAQEMTIETAPPLQSRDYKDINSDGMSATSSKLIPTQTMAVRRLMPIECERLQGFPDDWTRIPWRKKAAEDCPDGPRYKAIGNSMAVNVMQWIGIRLAMVNEIVDNEETK